MAISDQMNRNRARKLAAQQQAASTAQRERVTPTLSATVTDRDDTTGLWIATLPGGGTIPVESQTTANLLGQRVSLGRDITGGLAVVDAAPVPEDQAAFLRSVEKSEADLFNLAVHQVGSGNPNDLDGDGSNRQQPARYSKDLYLDSSTGIWYYWNPDEEVWLGETIAISIPIQGAVIQQYPVLFAWCRLRIESLSIQNKDADGADVTDGTAVLLADGSAVTLGQTLLDVDGYLSLDVTDEGEDFLVASITVVPA
jgi:hypothetical protein